MLAHLKKITHMTGAFLRGPSTKDACCEVESVFLHVCLAFVFINYWQLKPTELAKYDNPAEFSGWVLHRYILPGLLWDYQRWNLPPPLWPPNLSKIGFLYVHFRQQFENTPATFPSCSPPKLWPCEGRQAGGKVRRSTRSPDFAIYIQLPM